MLKSKERLHKKGIDQLEKIMLANKKYYNQNVLITKGDCGTELCAAGFAYLLEVGQEKFDLESQRQTNRYSQAFADRCFRAGRKLLGLDPARCSYVFDYTSLWPHDLRDRYDSIITPLARVRFYIKMLRTCARRDGTISPM